jgi:hypothetical protein
MNVVRIDTAPFMAAMAKLKKEVPVEMHTIMRWQMGLWVRDIIAKIYGNPAKKLAPQKKDGEDAIYFDLMGSRKAGSLYQVFVESEQKPKHMPGMQAYSMKSKKGVVYFVDEKAIDFNPSSRSFKDRHMTYRNKRGRVKAPPPAFRMHGKAKIIQTPTVPKDRLEAYIKTVQARVGRAKASWLVAYDHFKQTVGFNLLPWSAPSWIQRHRTSVGTFGHIADRIDENAGTIDIEAGSELLFGDNPEDALNRTWPTRFRDLTGPYAMLRLKGRIQKYNATAARRAA